MLTDRSHFTVDRLKWSRGEGKNTKLLDLSGKMDCIGFLLKANGAKDYQILDVDEPIDLIKKTEWLTKLIEWAGSVCYHSNVCRDIILVNDMKGMQDSWRETRLIELFASIGIKLEFVG